MARNLYEEVTKRILDQLCSGTVPWVKPWKSTYETTTVRVGGCIPVNAVSNRQYRGTNVVVLWMTQSAFNFTSSRWLTFNQCKNAGGNVKKGSKGTPIYFMSKFETTSKETGEPVNVPFLKTFTVFNVEQCENLPDNIVTGAGAKEVESAPVITAANRNEIADEFIRSLNSKLTHGGDRACFIPALDLIQMPEFEAFKTGDSYYSTLFHEHGHWTGHTTRLNRTFGARFGDQEYAFEELVAELTAAFLCAEFSMDGECRHADYIASWIKFLSNNPKAFFTAASQAQKAVDHMKGIALADTEEEEMEKVA